MGAAIITAIKLILRVSDRCGRTGFLSTRKIVLVSPLRPIPRILLISKDLFFLSPAIRLSSTHVRSDSLHYIPFC